MKSKMDIAKAAIEEVFGDTDASPEEAIERLETLADEIENYIQTLQDEIAE